MQCVLTHDMLSHAMCTRTQHAPPCDTLSYTCPHVQIHSHILTRTLMCTPTHTWAYGPMVIHACASPRCSHTSTHRKRHAESQRNMPRPAPSHTQPHPWPPPKYTWTHTTQKHMHTKIHTWSCVWTTLEPRCTRRKTPREPHMYTHRVGRTHRHMDTHTHIKVTASCSYTPKISQPKAGPGTHPGQQDRPDTGGGAVFPAPAWQPSPL